MKRVLVTGATGLVGRQVIRYLNKLNADITIVLRSKKDYDYGLDLSLYNVVYTKNIFSEKEEWWCHHLRDIDVVIHCAWYAEPGQYLNSPMNLECLKGTLTMAQAVTQTCVQKVVGIGTCFEYDLSFEKLDVSAMLSPKTLYAATKVSAFYSLSEICRLNNISFAWCRLFYLFGEQEDERRLYKYVITKLRANEIVELTEGSQVRDFLPVSAAGKFIAKVGLGSSEGPLNICSGDEVTVKTFVSQIAKEMGKEELLKFGARPNNIMDPPYIVGIPSIII